MKMAALILSTLLTPLASQAQDCHLLPDGEAVRQCLNNYGRTVLRTNSPAGVQDIYFKTLADVLDKAGISSLDLSKTKTLAQAFTIEIPETRDAQDSNRPTCFSFENSLVRAALGVSTQQLAQKIQKQMKEAAYFLTTYHAWSLGKEASHLFQVRRVELCAGMEKTLAFEKNTLRIQMMFAPFEEPGFSAKELFTEWQNGNAIFGETIGFFGKFTASKEALIKDKLRAAWPVLNPLGDLRYGLRIGIHKKTGQTLNELLSGGRSAADAVAEKSREFGLQAVSLTDDQARNVIDAYAEKMNSSDFVNQAVEQLITELGSGTGVENNDNRVNVGLVAIKNNKQISINVGSVFTSSIDLKEEVEQLRATNTVSANLNSRNVGIVAIDLFDQVVVNVNGSQLLQIVQRLGLKEALKNKDVRPLQRAQDILL